MGTQVGTCTAAPHDVAPAPRIFVSSLEEHRRGQSPLHISHKAQNIPTYISKHKYCNSNRTRTRQDIYSSTRNNNSMSSDAPTTCHVKNISSQTVSPQSTPRTTSKPSTNHARPRVKSATSSASAARSRTCPSPKMATPNRQQSHSRSPRPPRPPSSLTTPN